MTVMKFGVGQPVRRVEDDRLVRGEGRYTSDLAPDGALHAVFVRSPHAHARFFAHGRDRAAAVDGVEAVYLASDFADLADLPCFGLVANADGSKTPSKPYPAMARDEAHHVGDIVAMVVARSEFAARDGAEGLAIDWEPLPAVAAAVDALRPEAVRVFAGAPGNVAFDARLGDAAKTDEAFAAAARTVAITIVNPRVVANYMEPRGAVAAYNPDTGKLTLHVGSQGVHGLRDAVAQVLKIAPDQLRVTTGDVGGGFGTRIFLYREYPLLLVAAQRLGRPVRWQADRSEHFVGDTHGRDNVATAEMALDADGRFLALRVDVVANLGAYLSQFAPFVPWLGVTMATGPYAIDALAARVRGVYTHTVPVDAYRGAGRPEAAYLLERLVDRCARETGLSQEEIRLRNFVPSAAMPYLTQTKRTYDVGDFAGALTRCADKADVAGFAARAAESKARGRLRGLGLASYVECTAMGAGESDTSLTLGKDGTFTLLIGTQSTGQGHETAYAQVVSERFDIPLERIRVVQGDSDRVKSGGGTGGSRSIPIGAVTAGRAAKTLADSLADLAADALEAAASDLEIVDGAFRIVGTDRSLSFAEIAALPAATPDRLEGLGAYTPDMATYPNGTHICEVEIDPDTGVARLDRFTIVDDFGATLNPLLLEGQVHGGVAQAVGQALMEGAVYDDDGQLLTASFMDYCMPRADNFPAIAFETRNVPSTTNPMGLKGAGEAGTIGAAPAVVNAVVDALWRAYGVADIDMPATPQAIFRAIRKAEASKRPA
ncbi:xanthine dehydrogenase molybdenum binding subunit apoprotein [Roseiarcus fermentans]|uniref:Xanthine dehydrogenase molybdenum binding subunit apoprotein n=1 Tax=Roseiarcus fermentans TaxID=1473586 RepID=A0A366FP11_9HYPH|nr:xanthine dehydrogenase family protein molybdopterin-binding subunit [Roseiarcus fermentans]RBP16368.1 xanthine dehydrogenase molybdenum binding subunit apoprotein [Roseiarcus fermentans]